MNLEIMADNHRNSTGLTGLEPATSAVTGRCSNQLNYSPKFLQILVFHESNFLQTFTSITVKGIFVKSWLASFC